MLLLFLFASLVGVCSGVEVSLEGGKSPWNLPNTETSIGYPGLIDCAWDSSHLGLINISIVAILRSSEEVAFTYPNVVDTGNYTFYLPSVANLTVFTNGYIMRMCASDGTCFNSDVFQVVKSACFNANSTCASCTAQMCGWCQDSSSPSGGNCLMGDQSGPKGYTCPGVWYTPGGYPSCPSLPPASTSRSNDVPQISGTYTQRSCSCPSEAAGFCTSKFDERYFMNEAQDSVWLVPSTGEKGFMNLSGTVHVDSTVVLRSTDGSRNCMGDVHYRRLSLICNKVIAYDVGCNVDFECTDGPCLFHDQYSGASPLFFPIVMGIAAFAGILCVGIVIAIVLASRKRDNQRLVDPELIREWEHCRRNMPQVAAEVKAKVDRRSARRMQRKHSGQHVRFSPEETVFGDQACSPASLSPPSPGPSLLDFDSTARCHVVGPYGPRSPNKDFSQASIVRMPPMEITRIRSPPPPPPLINIEHSSLDSSSTLTDSREDMETTKLLSPPKHNP